MSTIEIGNVECKSWLDFITVEHEFYTNLHGTSQKGIKYITFSYIPYNAVGDIVGKEVSSKLTGPFALGIKDHMKAEDLWCDSTIQKIVISKIHIQFSDNTEETIQGQKIVYMDDPKSDYYRHYVRNPWAEKILTKHYLNETDAKNALLEVTSKFKDDKQALFFIFEILYKFSVNLGYDSLSSVKLEMGYLIGDYIEEHYRKEKKLAVNYWKLSISYQRTRKISSANKDYPEKYAEKIRKYEPEYVIPSKKSFWERIFKKIKAQN